MGTSEQAIVTRTMGAVLMTAMSVASTGWAHGAGASGPVEVLVASDTLKTLAIPAVHTNERVGVSYAVITPEQQERISEYNHANGRCGGFEVLPAQNGFATRRVQELSDLADRVERDQRWESFLPRFVAVPERPEITAALATASEQNLRDFVAWASNFPSRDNRGQDPNVAQRALVEKLGQMIAASPVLRQAGATAELITHSSTRQVSVRVRVPGTTRPDEVIVMGGHFDSINSRGGQAPGADDNASGSSNVFEAFRVITSRGATARTLEFYWYAGEESGLLGSAEIARQAKAEGRKVMAVLQLDMTLFPGSGELVLGNMGDFTSAWLRDFLVGINETYLHARLVDDRCGYGCSDHASWYRQGFPTLMPFEATMGTMNRQIHTANDVVSNQSSFRHSMVFTKIAIIFGLELGNNLSLAQPY